MKIELSKEISVASRGTNSEIGMQDIWFWVRAYEKNDVKIVSECFREETAATSFYEGLLKHYSQFKTYGPINEVIKSYDL